MSVRVWSATLLVSWLLPHAVGLRAAEPLPTVPEGFQIELVAKEPLIHNPCSMVFGRRGRLFVGMGPQYRNPKRDTPGDSVVILYDRDRDGIFDSKATFATGFNCIQGLAWHGGDLWVANAPDLTVVRDTDGDDVADQYVRIYTDLGNLEHGLHGLNWGPDGRLYMSKGNSKGLTRPGRIAPLPFRKLWGVTAPAGSPDFPPSKTYRPQDYKLTYHNPADDWGREGGVLVCDDMGKNLEIVSRGYRNPWDIAFDSGFNWQGTDNDQNEGDRVFMPFFGSHFGWGHSWTAHWTGKDHLPTAPISGPVFHGSGTGICYAESATFPQQFQGVFFFNDWLRKTTFYYRPRWNGALMEPEGGEWKEFVRGGKALFKPTDLEVGPDGALYILGWGTEYGVKWNDRNEQVNEGRVYRVSWTKSQKPKSDGRPLRDLSVRDLVARFRGPLPIWRTDAQGELLRRGAVARRELRRLLDKEQLTRAEVTWSLWTLGLMSGATDEVNSYFALSLSKAYSAQKSQAARQLEAKVQAARIIAHRMTKLKTPAELPQPIIDALKDREPRVRLEAIQVIRRTGQSRRLQDLRAVVAAEQDRVVFYAAWQALRHLASEQQLRVGLKDKRAGVRRACLLSLAEDRRLEPEDIQPLLGDSDAGVRTVAGLWLSKSNGNPLLVISPQPREFVGEMQVSIVPGLKPADIRYTTDGSPPTADSPRWPGQVRLTKTTTLKAGLFVNGHSVGATTTWTYKLIGANESARRSGVFAVRARSKQRYTIVDGGLRRGAPAYTDRPYRFTEFPPAMRNALVIRTSNEDSGSTGDSFVEIDAVIPLTIYVGHDTRVAGTPKWLMSAGRTPFKKTDMFVKTNDASFRLFERRFPAGTITLGGNSLDGDDGGKSNYVIIVRPAGLPRLSQPTTEKEVLAQLPKADPAKGRALYFATGGAGCAKCHRADESGLGFGPDLANLTKRQDPKHIVESILAPSAQIKEGFAMQTILTNKGTIVNGLLREETGQVLTLVTADGEQRSIRKSSVERRKSDRVSAMPSFDRLLTAKQVADITAWLLQRKK